MQQYTTLQTIINRLNRWQTASQVEDGYKVRDVDEALRRLGRSQKLPWALSRRSIRVFQDVLIYPVDDDFDGMAILDNDRSGLANRVRPVYTSIPEFLEDRDYRNDVAEIWDGGQKYLGIRYNAPQSSSRILESAENTDGWAVTGGTLTADTVMTFGGRNTSIRLDVVTPGNVTISSAFSSVSDPNYRRNYFFFDIYLPSVPTSITLKLGSDVSDYLSTTVTTQFSGQAMKAGALNTFAIDLNTATETGTFDPNSIGIQEATITGAAAGAYYISASYLRSWSLLDLWVYSRYLIAAADSNTPTKSYFTNEDANSYELTDKLIGDEEFVDVVMYDALLLGIVDKENSKIKDEITDRRDEAWGKLADKYPSLEQLMITHTYQFTNDPRFRGEYDDPRN